MQAYYSDQFVLPLPTGHRFPMAKYAMLRAQLAADYPFVQFMPAPAATDGELALAHSPAYVSAIAAGTLSPAAQKEIGFPWSPAMVERARRSVGATVGAVRAAMRDGVAANLAGGTHHAYRNIGSGFCVFNDSAIAARALQREVSSTLKVAIVDLDVHQGNGTASILQHDKSIFTLSIHGENNFPFTKEQSDLDIGLPNGCKDEDYLKALGRGLEMLDTFKPDFIIYLAGADPHEGDRLGKLDISKAGMRQRDERVFQYGADRQIPIAFSMAGGYGKEIGTTVDIHFQTIQTALQFTSAS